MGDWNHLAQPKSFIAMVRKMEGPVREESKHRWLRAWQPKEVFIVNTVKAEATLSTEKGSLSSSPAMNGVGLSADAVQCDSP